MMTRNYAVHVNQSGVQNVRITCTPTVSSLHVAVVRSRQPPVRVSALETISTVVVGVDGAIVSRNQSIVSAPGCEQLNDSTTPHRGCFLINAALTPCRN